MPIIGRAFVRGQHSSQSVSNTDRAWWLRRRGWSSHRVASPARGAARDRRADL